MNKMVITVGSNN